MLRVVMVCVALSTTVFSPTTARASRFGAGIEVGYAGENNSLYSKVGFQLNLARHLRLAPSLGYVFSHQNRSAFLFDADLQMPVRISNGIAFYPLAGMSINNWTHSHDVSNLRIGANLGAGCEFLLTREIKLYVTCKYTVIRNYSSLYSGLGMIYNF